MLVKKQKTIFFFAIFFVWVLFLNFYSAFANQTSVTLAIAITGEGTGKVVAEDKADILCSDKGGCLFFVPSGSSFRFSAYPDFDSTMKGWKAPASCLGQTECSLIVNGSSSVWVEFEKYAVKPGDEECASAGGRCIDLEVYSPYGPCSVNGLSGRIDREKSCDAQDGLLYRCCVPIDEEKDKGCTEQGGACIWLGDSDPKTEGAVCTVGGKEGKLSLNLCQSDPANYYSCCIPDLELTFTADPEMIAKEEKSTLVWVAKGAEICEASEGDDSWFGEKVLEGEMEVIPTETTTYVLTCKVGTREIEKSVTVEVEGLAIEFTADPEEIEEGESSTLEWEALYKLKEEEEGEEGEEEEVLGETTLRTEITCEATDGDGEDEWPGEKEKEGQEVVSPEETTTYTLTCEDGIDEVTESVTVKIKDPVESDRGCEEIGGKCMWVDPDDVEESRGGDEWWKILGVEDDIMPKKGDKKKAEKCDTNCLLEGLCRSEEQEYRDGLRYMCCAPEHYCEKDEKNWDNMGLNLPCPFMLADPEEQRGQECHQWCLEGPEDMNPALMTHLHSNRLTDGNSQTESPYRSTNATNSVVISHCHTNGFQAPANGRVENVYQIGKLPGTEIVGGILEIITDDGYSYRIEPSFPLGSFRNALPDGVSKGATFQEGDVLLKLGFGEDNADSTERRLESVGCNEYGLYVEVFEGNFGKAEACADCHFVNNFRCNFYSTIDGSKDGAKEDCGRCQRFGSIPNCKDKKGGALVNQRLCTIRNGADRWHGQFGAFLGEKALLCGQADSVCEDNCIKPNPKNYCCWAEWDICFRRVFTENGWVCVQQPSCIPIHRECPKDPCWGKD